MGLARQDFFMLTCQQAIGHKASQGRGFVKHNQTRQQLNYWMRCIFIRDTFGIKTVNSMTAPLIYISRRANKIPPRIKSMLPIPVHVDRLSKPISQWAVTIFT